MIRIREMPEMKMLLMDTKKMIYFYQAVLTLSVRIVLLLTEQEIPWEPLYRSMAIHIMGIPIQIQISGQDSRI